MGISKFIGKDPSTISKEVRKNRTIKYWKDPDRMPGCSLWKTCQKKHVCSDCFSKKTVGIAPNIGTIVLIIAPRYAESWISPPIHAMPVQALSVVNTIAGFMLQDMQMIAIESYLYHREKVSIRLRKICRYLIN